MKVTKDKVSDLLKAQNALNDKYVQGWRDELQLEHFKSAFLCEFAEFLESTPRFGVNTPKFTGWKWWKTYLEDDVQNSKVEIIDMLHFGLSYHILAKFRENKLYSKPEDFDNNEFLIDVLDALFPKSEKKNLLRLAYHEMDKFFETANLSHLFAFLSILASHHYMSMYDVYKGYFLKNELNLQRIENGYLEGTYEKVDAQGNEDNRSLKV